MPAREGVGDGFGANVDTLRRVLRLVSRRRWLALGVAAGVAVASAVAVVATPDRFEASARVYVDTQRVLKPLMASLTFQPDIDQQVSMLARTLISRPNIDLLVRTPELGMDVATGSAREELVSKLMKQIKIVPTTSSNLYEISYRGPSPDHAKRLVEGTVNLFVHSNSGAKRRDSQEAGRFIEEQIRDYEAKLTEAENRLKEFKLRNYGVSGVSSQDYFSRVSALTEKVSNLRLDLNAAEQTRDAYRRELAAEDPLLPIEAGPRPTGTPSADSQARLDAEKKHLDELLSRFTEAHPDVSGTRRVISQLEVEVRERREAEERLLAKSGKSGKAATSPIYQKLRISLAEAEAQVASLRSRLSAQQTQLEQVRSMAGRVPQAEAELAQLNRDYDIIRKNYDQMVARRESAALVEKLDASSQLAEFRVVEPPRVSPSPVFPSRVHLALLAVALCLVAGLAAPLIADSVRPTIDGIQALRKVSARVVIGSISVLVTPEIERSRRASGLRFLAGIAMLLLAQVAWIAWVASHPNVFWIPQ